MISTYGTTGTHLASKNIVAENHNFNTMACEQTFAWLSRHKKIIIMCHEQVPLSFYLHRLANSYISYTTGKRVVSPQALSNN